MSKQLTKEERIKICTLSELGKSTREIAKIVAANQSTVVRTIAKYKKYSTTDHLKMNGRPTKITEGLIERVKQEIEKNNKMSLRKLREKIFESMEIKIGHVTIKKILNNMNLYASSPIKKPLLSKKNIKKRFDICQEWIKMTKEEVRTIIFSDECKFNLYYSDGIKKIWRKKKDGLKKGNVVGTVKFGKSSVMVWGCLSYNGVGKLHFIDGIMDAAEYCKILSDNLFESARKMCLDEFVFQQDNDPKHKSRLAMDFFNERDIRLLNWPAQSPDMNPIENVWGLIKAKVAELQPKSIQELKNAIIGEWEKIPIDYTRKLVDGFKKRAITLYRAKGFHTKH